MGLKLMHFPTILTICSATKKRTAFAIKNLAMLSSNGSIIDTKLCFSYRQFMVAGLGDIKMSGVNIIGQINFVFMVCNTMLVRCFYCTTYQNHEGKTSHATVMGLVASILYVIYKSLLPHFIDGGE